MNAGAARAGAAPRSAAIVNLGCKVNQAEMAAAARLLRDAGVPLVEPAARADLVVVNTCTVTAVADEKSRSAVRRARRANPDAEIVVTGCSVQVSRAGLAAADPTARLVDNPGKAALLRELEALVVVGRTPSLRSPLPTLSGVEAVAGNAGAGIDADVVAAGAIAADAIVADDRASVERTRAFVKVQDGCSFFCTYCIIPRARGPERSFTSDEVLADVRREIAVGHREVVLTGINIGTYDGGWSERGFRGRHVRSALTLAGLVRRILDDTAVERVRLSSIEPQHVEDELLDVWRSSDGRCLPHFHLPLQSGDDGVLRRMGRRYTTAEYAATVARVRRTVPGVAVHADVIAGFPTEDDAAFERTRSFVSELDLAGLHVFRYSERPGTAASRMRGQVDEVTKKRRSAVLLALADEARARRVATRIGENARVLLERRLPDARWVGHAEDHVLVAVETKADGRNLENAIASVMLTGPDGTARGRAAGTLLALDAPGGRHG